MRIPGRAPRRTPRRARTASADEVVPLDPVALTLAVWLGLMAGVFGMIRMSETAAAQADLNRGRAVPSVEAPMPGLAFSG